MDFAFLLLPLFYLALAGLTLLAALRSLASFVTFARKPDHQTARIAPRSLLFVILPLGLLLVTQGLSMNADVPLAGAPPTNAERATARRLIPLGSLLALLAASALVLWDRLRPPPSDAGGGGGLLEELE